MKFETWESWLIFIASKPAYIIVVTARLISPSKSEATWWKLCKCMGRAIHCAVKCIKTWAPFWIITGSSQLSIICTDLPVALKGFSCDHFSQVFLKMPGTDLGTFCIQNWCSITELWPFIWAIAFTFVWMYVKETLVSGHHDLFGFTGLV